MYIAVEIKRFVYYGANYKDAYLKGCKQLAKYIGSAKYKNICFKAEKMESENAFVFILFTKIDANLEQKNFCKMCKEMHTQFFINEEYNCKRCNLKSFLSRAGSHLKISKNFYKEKIY